MALFLLLLAILPRIPLIVAHEGHADAEGTIQIARQMIAELRLLPGRPPGAPWYNSALAALELLFSRTGLPYYYYTNAFSALCTGIALYFLYKICKHFLTPAQSLAVVALFNFHPHMLVMGASTHEMAFCLALMTAAFWLYLRGKPLAAALLAIVAVGARMQAVALAAPLAAALLWRDYRKQDWRKLAPHLLACACVAAVVALPALSHFGPFFFRQPFHEGQFTAIQKLGAFVLRTSHSMGPLGLALLLYVLAIRWKRQKRGETFHVLSAMFALTVAIVFAAPWETYYLLPIVPVAIAYMVAYARRPVLLVFLASLLLPNLIQIQIKPWKPSSLITIREGVVAAHLRRSWIIRGGG